MGTRARTIQLKTAISVILVSAAALPLLPALADEQTKSVALEEVVVTGSRIRGAAPVGSSVIGIDRADIVDSPGVTVDRIIKELPQISSLGVSEASRGQSGGSGNITWGNAINIHGIGPFATLVLLDGHRTITNSRAIDPSIVPSLGLERIEIVADGASAVYGSDAVAGVVNLIPRRSLNGVETSLRYGTADHFDENQIGVAAGKVWDSGQVMVAFEHAYRSNLNGDYRAFYTGDQRQFGGTDYRVTRCSPGTLHGTAGAGQPTLNFAIPPGGVTSATAATLVAGTTNRCDDLPGQDLLPEQKYNTGNFTYTQSFSDKIEIFADGFYSKRDFERLPAYLSIAASAAAIPATNAFFVQPPGTVGATSVDYSFRELPRDVQTGSSENWEVTPGLRIKLPHDFQFETLYTYGKNDDEANSYHGLNNAALGAALSSGNPATAFDPYGLGRTTAATLATLNDQIFLAPTINVFNGYELRLNGPLFNLSGGSVRLATGYEHQDLAVSLGLARGGPTAPLVYREFSRHIDSGYLELLVPLFSNSNAITGIRQLEFTGAVRYDKYSDVGDTTNPKFGFNYAPIESLTFHGSYGTSFRAPLISEIYGNSNALFGQSYQNPAGGAPLTGFALSGGNLDLKPEEATTWSFGADFKPTANTDINLTYFSVNYEKQVANYLSNLALLTIEPQFAGTGIILHGAEAGARVADLFNNQHIPLARGAFPGGDPNNVTLFIDGRSNNLGVSITRGIDFQATQHLKTDAAGSFTFMLGGTYLTDYEVAITEAGTRVDRLNTIFNPQRFKGRGSVTWDYGALTTQAVVYYVNAYDNNAVTPTQTVGSYAPVNISIIFHGDNIGWLGSFGSGLSIGLEVRNAFDTDPPYVNIAQSANGGGGYDPTVADPVGRLFAVLLRKNW